MEGQLGTVGRYRLRRILGRGSMGVVYEAHDPALGRTVAIKTIDLAFSVEESERRAYVQRFLVEARAAAGLQHPNIVVVFDIGRDDAGVLFLALEHLAGHTLEQVLEAGPLEWRRALHVARQIALGLHHAHRSGIVHRDVKPSNVMLLEADHAKILDFGIAKLPAGQLTADGQSFGTPAYMSPEQAEGRPVDARSDVFSLGSVLFEMLTGHRPFEARSVAVIVARVMRETAPTPRSLVPSLPPVLDALLAGAHARDPADRYPDAEAFASDIAAVLEGGHPERAPRRGAEASGTAASHPRVSTAVTPSLDFEQTVESQRVGLKLPPGRRVSLAVVGGPAAGQVFPVERARVTIGRAGSGATADVQIPDSEVSRMHVALQSDGARFEIQDLGSTNGTFVDGARVEAREVANQGEFSIGASTLLLIVSDPE